ncbi:MAG: HAD family hydrolase [Bacteroidales bacterium]|nr:HAD family hydrolase [Bacteroidales bacterium]
MFNDFQKNSNWSIFLDRDGVINERIVGGYVKHAKDFRFVPGSLEAIRLFSELFKQVFIVTNQQGIGKGLMTESELQAIHSKMLTEIQNAGGRIDRIYFCGDLATEKPNCRKPGISMALAAKKDFPSVDFQKSIMVGDTLSDMQFGTNAGMHCVFILGKHGSHQANYPEFNSLIDFANTLNTN